MNQICLLVTNVLLTLRRLPAQTPDEHLTVKTTQTSDQQVPRVCV